MLQATNISLDRLIAKLEFALSQEVARPPRLLVAKTDDAMDLLCPHIVCDVNQVVYSLVNAVLRVAGRLDGSNPPIVNIQLYATALRFKQTDPIDNSYPPCMLFEAIALVVSNAAISALPKVKPFYDDTVGAIGPEVKRVVQPSIDIQQETISSMIRAHYGYLEWPADGNQQAMLLVLPIDVKAICDKMMVKLPIDCLTSETPGFCRVYIFLSIGFSFK